MEMAGTPAMEQKPELIKNDFRHKNCPLCGAVNIHKAGEVDYGPCVNFSTHRVKLLLTPELWNCAACGSGFMQNVLPEKVAAGLYGSGVGGERWLSTAETEKTDKVVAVLKELFAKGSRVLDIGCNTGEILDLAKANGCDTVGVEYCLNSIETVRKKGHACFSSLGATEGRFDVITSLDLVEHLYDVQAFLNTCYEKLSPEGCLVLLTGDIQSLSARVTGASWWYVRYPEHIVFPSKRYFMSDRRFLIEKWTRTYAYVLYISTASGALKGFFKGMIRGIYTGLPSLGPDHVLAILRKR